MKTRLYLKTLKTKEFYFLMIVQVLNKKGILGIEIWLLKSHKNRFLSPN